MSGHIGDVSVEVTVTYGAGSGTMIQLFMGLGEYQKHAGKERELIAARVGVPWEKIVEWNSLGGHLQCNALTRKKLRCRCIVGGGSFSRVSDWAKADAEGLYCFTHSMEAPQTR